jgi:hypothetical protein
MFTDPALTTAMPLDRGIRFYLQGSKVEAKPVNSVAPDEPPQADDGAASGKTLIIGNLACAERVPLQINPSKSVEAALTTMALNDYSQLVVTSGPRNIRGIISYKSIAQAFLHGNPKIVNDCLDKSAPLVERDEPLMKVIERFNKSDVVLVIASDKSPAGIVTPADIAAEFGAMAAPFFLIGQIEEQLRWLVSEKLDVSVIVPSTTTASLQLDSVSDLTMGDLHRLLSDEANWAKVGIKFDRAAFCAELDEVRSIRNAVMHFRELPDGATTRVEKFADAVQIAYLAREKGG